MDSLVPDFDALPDPSDPDYATQNLNWLAGTYGSGWGTLKAAAWSSAYSALHGASIAYDTWLRIQARRRPPAELDFLMDLNYTASFHGAALGSIVVAAFALESFLRTGYVVAVELRRTRRDRTKGLDSDLKRELRDFDGAATRKRLQLLRARAAYSYSKSVEAAAVALVDYRNTLAHDSPELRRVSGTETAYRDRGSPAAPYEPLTSSHRPARLKQVRSAITAHDEFVKHALSTAEAEGWSTEMKKFGKPWVGISEAMPGKPWWSQLETLAEAWEAGPEKRAATEVEFFDFRNQFARRTKLKILP